MIALPGIAIQDKIYESSNSLVYRGIRDDGVAIIVKMLKLDYPSFQELTRYRQEYKITRSLKLEGVIKAYNQQDYQRTLVILLEDFGGESLEQWMHKRPDIFCPMPLSTFLGLAIALTDILGRIHAANIIHKDINPGNIVLNLDTGIVKIIDFGIATQFNRTNPTFKSPHVLEGTLAYLSPEQTGRMNRLLDYRTDFYSLGVTFYELLTGQLPFPTTDVLELVHCHIAKHPIPPHEINTTIPKPVSDIILKLMAKNAENRYQSAWGIKADLEICGEQLAEIGQISSIQLALQDTSGQFQIPQKLYGRDKENYLHEFYLVEAEKARVLGQFLEAEEFYERAIALAAENEFIQEEALAYELAAKHYLARGRSKIAQTYMKEAHYCYDRWGATAKVKDLEKRYPQLLNTNLVRQSHSIVTDETIRHPTAAIDWAAAMKAAQAISEMIHLDQLTATLMQVVIENAGAETGALVLLEDDRLTVVAQCSGSRQCNLEKITVASCATIPVSVIQSVERTFETLVFDDAISEPSFSTDRYIQNQQTRSLLCMPILKQNQLIGILYLENNLSTGVFTSDRLQVLKLLIAQAAISLENARLYERLSDYSETLERKVEEQTQALQQEIAERQQTEAALRQSEANYRNLLQTANSVIIRYDPQGRIHYINDYGVKLLGYEEHQILGRTLFETIIPDIEISGRDVKPFVHDLLRNPQSYPQGEGENLCRDGRRVWMAWSNQAIFNEQGDVVEILSVGNDTTQRRQAEEALQRSETKFRTIFENSQVGIYRTRTDDGLILNANQRFADLFGFDSPEEIIGLEHTTGYYVNQGDRQQAIELLKRDGEVRSFEAQMRKRDGTVFWGLFSSYLNAGDDYIEGVIADISDHKQAEVALQASEAELRALFSAIPDPICIFNAEGQLICAIQGNPSYGELHREEYIGKTLHQLYATEQADEFLSYIQQVLRTQQVLTVEYSQWIAEREIWFSARIAPIRHEQVIWIARDITLQKRAEATSILEERNRMAREIHDTLAQAFTGILAQVGAAKQVLTDDLEATEAHLDLIKELARTGLVEARRSVVALRPQLLEEGSLQSALHRLVAQLRTAAMDTTLYYEIEGAVYSLPTEVESNLLRIGQEALTNAIRHANADEIRVKLIYDRDQFCLRVQDNGQGFGVGSIPASLGFGLLGMSERAERIGAQLTIRSQPGEGTEMIVTVDREASQ